MQKYNSQDAQPESNPYEFPWFLQRACQYVLEILLETRIRWQLPPPLAPLLLHLAPSCTLFLMSLQIFGRCSSLYKVYTQFKMCRFIFIAYICTRSCPSSGRQSAARGVRPLGTGADYFPRLPFAGSSISATPVHAYICDLAGTAKNNNHYSDVLLGYITRPYATMPSIPPLLSFKDTQNSMEQIMRETKRQYPFVRRVRVQH